MDKGNLSRRGFLGRSLAGLAAAGLPVWYARQYVAAHEDGEAKKTPASDRLVMGIVGVGSPVSRSLQVVGESRPSVEAGQLTFTLGCDVDASHRKRATEVMRQRGFKDFEANTKEFRDLVNNKSLDCLLVATPDHWHAQVTIEALKAGKDVYCEKPLTLTVAESLAVQKVVKDTGRILQTGSQQRTVFRGMFRLAVELVRAGRLGKIKTIECRLNGNPTSGPIPETPVPEGLDWDLWLGPTEKVPYRKKGNQSNCHYEFRWWYDYSGGKMTDWGAHHNDVAQWALGMDESGPISVESTAAAPSKDPNSYNCHPTFAVTYGYKSGAKVICKSNENGVLLEGEDGKWIFVHRGGIVASDEGIEKPTSSKGVKTSGKSKILTEPLGKDAIRLYESTNHMRNWLSCIKTRKPTTCTAEIGHRSVTVCHLGSINMRLGGKKMGWDPVAEKFDDEAANKMMSRPMRGEWKLEA